jgi:hypothetical protein
MRLMADNKRILSMRGLFESVIFCDSQWDVLTHGFLAVRQKSYLCYVWMSVREWLRGRAKSYEQDTESCIGSVVNSCALFAAFGCG